MRERREGKEIKGRGEKMINYGKNEKGEEGRDRERER